MSIFRILEVETGELYDACSGVVETFSSGAEASDRAKRLAQNYGVKFRVVKIEEDTLWREREQNKFNNGSYEVLPWYGYDWYQGRAARAIWKDHYAHPSNENPGMIAYTESPAKGAQDKQTQMKPGRYLEKYFSSILMGYGIDVRTLAMDFARRYEPRTLRFATTADEIQRVYETGPDSCMGSPEYRKRAGYGYPSPGLWPNDTHACRAYAAGDLQVAYIVEDDKDEKSRIFARAVVWPERKTHSRVYGDASRMTILLNKAGYTWASPTGARLARLPFKGRFIVPYLDAGDRSGGGSLYVIDEEKHLRIIDHMDNKSYAANSTSGLSTFRVDSGRNDDGDARCEHCEDDEGGYDLTRVFYGRTSQEFERWCSGCCDDNEDLYFCERHQRLYIEDQVPAVCMHGGHTWSQAAFEQYGAVCAGNGRLYSRDRMVQTRENNVWWSLDHFNEIGGFICEYSQRAHPREQLVLVEKEDGRVLKWARWVFEQMGFDCVRCHKPRMRGFRYKSTHYCKACFVPTEPKVEVVSIESELDKLVRELEAPRS